MSPGCSTPPRPADRQAAADLLPLVYDALRKLAAARMAAEAPDHILQPTALVHEAYLRLVGPADAARWDNRGHFLRRRGEAMRRILVEAARGKQRVKHGGGRQRDDQALLEVAVPAFPDDLLALDEALDKLATADPTAARLVTLAVLLRSQHPTSSRNPEHRATDGRPAVGLCPRVPARGNRSRKLTAPWRDFARPRRMMV